MYEDFYAMDLAPFQITPDPTFLYLGPSHREALASIVYAVERRKGFVVVLGEVGLGKTTILRAYLDARDRDRVKPIYVFNANVSFAGLLDTIFRELGIAEPSADLNTRVHRLSEYLVEEYRRGGTVVLVVDEVQNMPVDTLEQLRLLSNLETANHKLLQIVLAGQVEFADTLDRHDLRQLKQRVAARCTLAPLTRDESIGYIQHRLATSGAAAEVFTKRALDRIVRHAAGIPRTLNIVCDNALMAGLGSQTKRVTASMVKEVIRDLSGKTRSPHAWWAAASLASMVLVGAGVSRLPIRDTQPAAPVASVEMTDAPRPVAAEPVADAVAAGADAAQADNSGIGHITPGQTAAISSAPAATRIVKQGDGLLRMAKDVYGAAAEAMLPQVVASNPQIADPNHIEVGTAVVFPRASDSATAFDTPLAISGKGQP